MRRKNSSKSVDKYLFNIVCISSISKIRAIYGLLMGCTIISACAPTASTFTVVDPIQAQSALTYNGPLVITKGGTYSGNWESLDPRVAAVSIQTSEPVTIENSNIRGRGTLIHGFGNRLTVKNVSGYGLNPRVAGWGVGMFVAAEEFINVRIENSFAENTRGFYFRKYKGDPSKGDTITILRNRISNINGLASDGKQDYDLNKRIDAAHFLQFNDVKGIPGSEIAWNEVINEPGKSLVEENINIYASSGTFQSPIKIHDNYIQGAYPLHPSTDSMYAGGGILVGDGAIDSPSETGYVNVYDNQIVSTTNEGIAIAGGHGNHVYGNRIVSSGLLPDGTRIKAQNVGMYFWNINISNPALVTNFRDNSMENNYVAWSTQNSDGTTGTHPWWLPDCGIRNNTCVGNTSGGVATLDSERQEYQRWQNKLVTASVKVGLEPQ